MAGHGAHRRRDLPCDEEIRTHASELRIALTDALVAYTQGGAYSSFDEQQLGKIAKGYLADIIVLSQDLFTMPPSEIHNTRVQMTIANGKVVYEKP